MSKDYDSAIEQMNKVIEMDEKFVEAYNMRGSCYSALKKNDEAFEKSNIIDIPDVNKSRETEVEIRKKFYRINK